MRAALFALWALFRLQRAEPSTLDFPVAFSLFYGYTLRLLLPNRPVAATAGRGPPALPA
jgi:hypothetical protein